MLVLTDSSHSSNIVTPKRGGRGGGGGRSYNGFYGEAPLVKGTFLGIQVYKMEGIL